MKIRSAPRHHFDRALLPPPDSFYLRELGNLSRPSRNWAKADCPFHSSNSHKSLHVNFKHGGYYCFGCGAKGDMVTFMRQRYDLGFKEACQSLGAWSESGLASREFHRLQRERERQQVERAEKAEAERQKCITACGRLHQLEQRYDYWNQRLIDLRKETDFNMESQDADTIVMFLSDCLDEIRNAESEYMRLCGLGVEE